MIYFAKYRPLVADHEGQLATQKFGLPSYIDASCRREPDLECEYPSISALCRGDLFAPKLKEGDEVVYITMKGFYGEKFKHWRLVARLKVLKRFETHQQAAVWYRETVGKLPSNCMVPGNPPLPLSHTSGPKSKCAPGCGSPSASLMQWDAQYKSRASQTPVFLACEAIWKQLANPAILTEKDAVKILGTWERVNSRLPIKISTSELIILERIASDQEDT